MVEKEGQARKRQLGGVVVKSASKKTKGGAAAGDDGHDSLFENLSALNYKPGCVVTGRVDFNKKGDGYVRVWLAPWVYGRLWETDIDDVDEWKTNPFEDLKQDQFIHCVLLKSLDPSKVDVSIRPSIIGSLGVGDMVDTKVLRAEFEQSKALPEVGTLVKGFVDRVASVGAFIRLSRGASAIVPMRNLADRYVKDAAKEFPVGKLVAGRIIEVDPSRPKIVASLSSSSVVGSSDVHTWDTLKSGDKLSGEVVRVEERYVLVHLSKSARLRGICHKSQIADEFVEDCSKLCSPGDNVRVVVLDVDKEKKTITLSMKASHFEGDEANESSSDDDEDDDENGGVEVLKGKFVSNKKVLSAVEDSDDDEESSESGDEESQDEEKAMSEDEGASSSDEEGSDASSSEEEGESKSGMTLQNILKKTKKTVKDESSDSDSDSDDESSGSEGEDKKSKTKTKSSSKTRERQRKLEEAALVAKEQAMLRDDSTPQSADEYERLLVGSPNSSQLWISYMAFQVSQTEVDQGRAIAERALNAINYREEEEKQNVLCALLRLENDFGTEKSVNKVIKRMTQQMEPEQAYFKVADMYKSKDQLEKADVALRKAVKASKGSSEEAWFRRMQLKFLMKDPAGAQKLLQSAIKEAPKSQANSLTMQYARLEYTHKAEGGDHERARTLIEKLIDNHPKRSDLWHQYIDAEIKYVGDANEIRKLFERVTSSKLSVKNMKTFFKKWLVYETENGTEETAEEVKTRARDYVASLSE